ncbi:phosphopyruvate hydratase [Euryarchaeota archaeon]|nr:phosphopyruvate hydratase [Candidatus Thalassarchaeum sp.]MDA7548720.1 phosphopyruvate hydratase [bacterium]MDB3855486.1 phosphopyruvate hydratase [Euryarchaeota archaeon]MDC0327714.1 phosphopyruvate hydratase [bacterium]MDC0851871.1 phosphopyruvate hydratase [Euryarchaeota archaeon]
MSGIITDLKARTIIDSRGNPTVEVDCYVDGFLAGRAAVPSGASTGSHEAVELRDNLANWSGKGVETAVNNVNSKIKDLLVGLNVSNQKEIDASMLTLDGTGNKANLGANAILGVSMAVIRAAALIAKTPLWRYVSENQDPSLPVPLMNILNGGAHAASNVDVQEFMVVPHGFDNFSDSLRAGTEIYHALKSVLKEEGLLGGVGDEGGFAPNLPRNEEGLRYLVGAIKKAGYSPGSQVSIALDVAAQEFFDGEKYHIDNRIIDGKELGNLYSSWIDNYPIVSLEDPFGEDDWSSWIEFTKREGSRVQIVGDDLYVTNPSRLQRGIETLASNSILIKLNQIGTVTETLQVIEMARKADFGIIISHRSGETSDDIIADISVGTNSGQIKTGAPARSDRTAKYNQLLRISETCSRYSQLF